MTSTALIGSYGADIPQRLSIAFGILSFVAFICFIQTAVLAHAKNHYRQTKIVRYLFPFVCLNVSIENLGYALARFLISSDGNEDFSVMGQAVIYFMAALQTTQVPILLLTTFEVCYLIHKRRSVNFCSMFFDEGHRVILVPTMVRGFLLRNMIRMIALLLLGMGIVVNFGLGIPKDNISALAGKAGWRSVMEIEDNKQEAFLILSLLPEAVLIVCSFYLSLVLWRYGTSSSMVVHSSICNPWFALFFGTIALGGGQFFNKEFYPFTSNLGLILFIFSVLLLMYEVDKDMDEADDFADFLKDGNRSNDKDDDEEANGVSSSKLEDGENQSNLVLDAEIQVQDEISGEIELSVSRKES